MPDLECACASVRRVARLVTQLYSDEMGLCVEPAQFALLKMLQQRPGISQAAACGALGFDKTTLSRNLRVLAKNGWIESIPGEDRRTRGSRLTAAGEEVILKATPGWRRAQQKLRAELGDEGWVRMMDVFGKVARAAAK
ncbi:MAG: MarR family winged helix-turn-helix transcriptional regulator [Bryobacteraceae bacterium]|nr:MarR family winged helix-turn-helix transcriptional regulator [Bryobacteraceae bacterium]